MDKKIAAGAVAALLFIGGGSFLGGMKYAEAKTAKARGAGRNMQFSGMGSGEVRMFGAGQGGFSRGEIIKKDDSSITLKMPDGSTKIVFYSASTKIGKTAGGLPADLEIGKTALASGKSGSDGSITADMIQLQSTAAPAAIGR